MPAICPQPAFPPPMLTSMTSRQHIFDSLVTGLDSAYRGGGTGGKLEGGSWRCLAAMSRTTLVAGAVLVAVTMAVVTEASVPGVRLKQLGSTSKSFRSIARWPPGRVFALKIQKHASFLQIQ